MKPILSLIPFLCNFCFVLAQSVGYEVADYDPELFNHRPADQSSVSRLSSCGPDTLTYSLQKANLTNSVVVSVTLPGLISVSQQYEVPNNQMVNVHGVQFYIASRTSNQSSIPFSCKIFHTNAMGLPVGVPLGDTVVSVPYVGNNIPSQRKQYIAFSQPVQVFQNFAIVMENLLDSTFAIMVNDFRTSPVASGRGENLASIKLGPASNWQALSNINAMGSTGSHPIDSDYLLHPVVSYDIQTEFVADRSCFMEDSIVNFTSTTSPIVFNRFFNLLAFNPYFGTHPDNTIAWDFGDNSPNAWGTDLSHTYSDVASSFTVKHFAQVLTCCGHECIDSVIVSYPGGGIPEAAFVNSLDSLNTIVSFDNQSTGATAYHWDFGDGNTSIEEAPAHDYDSTGVYTVRLIANSCEETLSDTIYQTIGVAAVNVGDDLIETLRVYPNPSQGHISVLLSLNQAQVVRMGLFNPLGQEIQRFGEEIARSGKYALDLSHMDAGVYFLKIEIGNRSLCKKIVLSKE